MAGDRLSAGALSACSAALTLLLLGSPPLRAFETPKLGDEPVSVAVTETARVLHNFDNRNSRGDVASAADDDWGALSSTLDARANWQNWQLGLRLDSAWFYAAPGPTEVALRLSDERGDASGGYDDQEAARFVQDLGQAGSELSDRYVSWTTPSRLSLTYATPSVEATIGDFYAQFGRGLVLSVRKQDELSSDTTIRGARLTGRLRDEDLRVTLTGLVGTSNPLRIDLASGRHLGTTRGVRSGLSQVTELGMPRRVSSEIVPEPMPNFAPDQIVGAELELRGKALAFSLAGARVARQCLDLGRGCESLSSDLVRSAGTIDTGGAAVDVPDLWGAGALYVEYAHQALRELRPSSLDSVSGNALYASWNLHVRPLVFTFEGKHYRRFFPIAANVDVGQAREFAPLQYNSPPTTLPVYADTEFEGFNTCVTGGRAQVDLALGRRQGVFGWLGHYQSWAESAPAGSCEVTDDNLNTVWDLGEGIELASEDRHSHGEVMLGARFDSTHHEISDARGVDTDVFYRELYARYDWVLGLSGSNALEFQGWHRRRRQTLGGPVEPWFQGTTTTALQLGSQLNLAFGFEYDQNPAFPDLYLNGQVRYELPPRVAWAPWLSGPSSLSLFVGQRQGGLRCVSGICRVFPPFEGVRLDLSMGF